jgi:hypothetical protein
MLNYAQEQLHFAVTFCGEVKITVVLIFSLLQQI